MPLCRFLALLSVLIACSSARAATVLVLQFHNNSSYPDLNWVGESVAETLRNEFSAANQIVLDRDSRAEGMRRLSLRPDAGFTKATLIRLGQVLDADYLCYGTYEIKLPAGETELKQSTVQLSAHFIDLRKMHDGPEMSEAGKLSEISRFEEHLAWQLLKYLEPGANLSLDRFISPQKLVRLDAKESYVRGLMSSSPEQQEKWFIQAAALDPHFASPAFELGKMALQRRDWRRAISLFQRIPPDNPSYPEVRFKMGLSAFGMADYSGAAGYFREVVKVFPLSEVYNNLGAAENEIGLPTAVDDFRRALDGDGNDPIYLFNLGAALLKNNSFAEASQRLQAVLERNPDDKEARGLLDRAQRRETTAAGAKSPAPERLKQNFDDIAFRQLKAMLQPKGS